MRQVQGLVGEDMEKGKGLNTKRKTDSSENWSGYKKGNHAKLRVVGESRI